jgi:hypothetical protein
MTPPPDKPQSAWSKLSGIWFAVNLGIPLIEMMLLLFGFNYDRGRGSFTQICALVVLALLVSSNVLLACLIGERSIERSIFVFVGSMLISGGLIFAGFVVLFLSGALGPHWG